ncbi:MAG: hypothetical protein ABW205_02180 [Burkholderiales bacterium]
MSRATITVVLTAMLNGWVLLTTCAAAVDPAPELALCRGKPTVMAALSRATTQARAVPERQRLTVQLSPEKSVALPGTSPDLDKERAKAKGPTYAGVVRLEVTRPGIYRVGTDRDAWVDIATASGKLLDPAPEEGTFTCDGAQKILLYTLPAAGSYWLQVALSSKRDIPLTIIRAD